MPSIKLLDTDTINQIAAGEVIDRPASIIKELVENSIDAGATSVSIEIQGGGIELMRITDNGSGINPEEVPVAFLRHATSKITDASQLPLVRSLGFRGEALASIAAIADVELITKTADSIVGTHYHIRGGIEIENSETGAPLGTTFIIRNVFDNVPVRKKFLKTSSTEGAICSETIERIALSHPEVSFKFKNNGRNIFFTNGNRKLKEMIYGIYGRDIANEMLETDGYSNGIHVYGVVARPVVARSNRNTENFFVNGRYIRSAIISKGIENAYQPYLMQHKYPFTCLYIDIDPLLMDVNVHPSKQEVRFENPEAVYLAVYDVVSAALQEKAHIQRFEKNSDIKKTSKIEKVSETKKNSEIEKTPETEKVLETKKDPEIEKASELMKASEIIKAPEINSIQSVHDNKNTSVISKNGYNHEPVSNEIENNSPSYASNIAQNDNISSSGIVEAVSIVADTDKNSYNAIPEPFEAKRMEQLSFDLKLEDSSEGHADTAEEFKNVFSKGYRIVGQVFNTYWIVECDGIMYMIDQHAAHEKIIYEKMMSDIGISSESEQLSPPKILTLSAQEAEAAERYKKELNDYGYTLEEFGGKEYALSTVPLNLYGLNAESLLFEILNELAELPTGSVLLSIKEKIATCSCKAAVKGNHELSEAEAKELITKLLKAENPFNCPHGRPIIIDYSKYEIEKKFKRVL